MSVRELQAHPDLVTRLDRDDEHRCPVLVFGCGDTSWRCHQPARWRVRSYLAQCALHAGRTLRRLLAEAAASEGGGS